MKSVMTFCAVISLAIAAEAACQGLGASRSPSPGTSRPTCVRRCPCTRLYWDVHPRPEFNPPDDIATLPEREQLKFVKMFKLVPDQVKVKSTQNYTGRMTFMNSPQYMAITNKLAAKLERSAKMLAADPAVTAAEVQKMCFDTIVYGRSLIMGRMEMGTFTELARQYHFKNAAKAIEILEDSKNFRRGLTTGYPRSEPECRDFEALAKRANSAQWQAFLDRVELLLAKQGGKKGRGAGQPAAAVTKQQLYDRYDATSRRELPADLVTLPNRERVRYSKIYDCLPVQVLSMAEQAYRQRRAYLQGTAYAEVRSALAARLAKDARRLAADPAITAAEVMKACDELVKYGRPLVCGDMRNVSLFELARTYRFQNVEKFVEAVEDSKNASRGFSTAYPMRNPEFADFATLAQHAYPDRWKEFLSRLSQLNAAAARKVASARR